MPRIQNYESEYLTVIGITEQVLNEDQRPYLSTQYRNMAIHIKMLNSELSVSHTGNSIVSRQFLDVT
jgi:hypothetical protein